MTLSNSRLSILSAKYLGADTPRKAAEMILEKRFTEEGWIEEKAFWEDAFYNEKELPIEKSAPKPQASKNWYLRIIGFLIGMAAIVALEAVIIAIMSSGYYRFTPKGLGWIIFPILGGLAGAAWFEQRSGAVAAKAKRDIDASITKRIFISSVVCWIVGVLAYVFVFQPFGRYWHSSDYAFLWKLLLVPPAVYAFGLFVFDKMGLLPTAKPQITNTADNPPSIPRTQSGWTPEELANMRTKTEVNTDEFSKKLKRAQERNSL